MAPEPALGQNRQISPLTDLYSRGAILDVMLAGKPPGKGLPGGRPS